MLLKRLKKKIMLKYVFGLTVSSLFKIIIEL